MNDFPFAQRKRIVVCRGQFCNAGKRADTLIKHLQQLISDSNNDDCAGFIKLEIASCLSICGAGPNIVSYPGDITFNGVDMSMLEQILNSK